MCGFISGLSVLFHWPIILFSCQYQGSMISVTVALSYNLKSENLIHPAPFFLFKNSLAKWEFVVWHRELNQWQPRRVGWGERWDSCLRGRGCSYTYGWFMWMYGRNQNNTVKQLLLQLKTHIFKNCFSYSTQNNLQIQCYPYQITNGIFHRTRTENTIIFIERQNTLHSQSNFEHDFNLDWILITKYF